MHEPAKHDATSHALRESEDPYRFLTENIPVQIWTARPDGLLDYVSEQTAHHLGVPSEQLLREGWQNVVHPDDLPQAAERWGHALQSGTVYEVEFRLKVRSGHYAWHLARAVPRRNGEGRIVQWFGTNTDIEEQREQRRRIEALLQQVEQQAAALRAGNELLREREAGLATTLASIGDGIVATDVDARITFLNPVAEKLTGWTLAEVQGRPLSTVFRIINEHSRAPVDSPVDRALREGTIVALANHTLLIRKDGDEIPIDDSAAPIRAASGEVTGAILVFRDVTDRKRAEKERERLLQQAQSARAEAQAERDKQHALFMQAPVAIAILEGPAHVFTFANPAYRALVNGRDVVGKPLLEALPDVRGQGFDHLLDQVMASGETFYGREVRIKLEHHAADECLILNFVYTPKRTAAGDIDGVLMSGSDVTELVLAREHAVTLAQQRQADLEARARAEAESEAARARLASLFEHAPAFVCTLRGPEHVFELVNPPYQRLVGATRALLGHRVAEALPEVVPQGFIGVLDGVYGTGIPFVGNETPIQLDRAGDGRLEEAFLNFVYQPSRNALGAIEGIDVFGFEITEQVRARQRVEALAAEVANERHKLEVVVTSSPAAIALWRGETLVFETVNAGYQALFPDRTLVGKALYDALPEVRAQGFPAIFEAIYKTGVPFVGREIKLEMAYRESSPVESRFFDVIYIRIDNRDGTPYGIYNHALDVTDRVTARLSLEAREAELRRSEERVRRIVEAAGVGLWDLDPRTGQIQSDDRLVELLGLPVGDTFSLTTALEGLPFPDDRDRVASALKDALDAQRGGRYLIEFRTGGRDGDPLRWIESRAQAYFDESGTATRLAGAMIDITARKAVEEERTRFAERITRLLDTMSDGFFAVDAEWKFTAVNETFERITHVRRGDALGTVVWNVFPTAREEKAAAWTNYHRCMQERVPVEFMTFNVPLGLWADVRANPTADGGMAVFFRDVTQAKRAEELARQQAAFERQLIGIVSHDLRNPLNVIAMAATMLRRQDDLSAKASQNVVRIQNAGERAVRMIRDLLDFTQARVGGGLPVDRRPCDLHAVTRAVMEEVEATHSDRSVRVETGGDAQGNWDPDRLGQVVQNLVTNALKYSAAGSPVDVITRGDSESAVLRVHNRGTPIPAETLPVLFEPFERGVGHADASTRSVGLGLYIVKQVVEAHGGVIDVQSTEGDGTTFTVTIPKNPPAKRESAPGATR